MSAWNTNPIFLNGMSDYLAEAVGTRKPSPGKHPRLKQSPVVLLRDCRGDKRTWSKINSLGKRKKAASDETFSTNVKKTFIEESMNGLLTPVPSNSPSVTSINSEKRKRRKSKKLEEHEVEEVVGYHLDKKNRMWYYLKWKGWSSAYNTYQLIEDMENCNKVLMEYFEYHPPTQPEMAKMDDEVKESVLKSDLYKRLIATNFSKSVFLEFTSSGLPDINPIFSDAFKSAYSEMEQEYEYIIRCLIGMVHHRDPGMFARAQRYRLALDICKMRVKQLERLKQQEATINSVEKCLVRVMNDKDLDVLPEGVEYFTELKPGNGVNISRDPWAGCDCPDGCTPKSNCCPSSMNVQFAYQKNKRLREPTFKEPIFECNSRCTCPDDCRNRVVQRGRTIPVAIFKTEFCGWGVKALEDIQKGSFVCEYFGEIISEEEADVRDVEYFPKNMNYMFDLDFNPDKKKSYCIDATSLGNFARYINHSCDPNLIVCPVWINCLNRDMPRLAFFSRRYIRKGEELSIDYESRVDGCYEDVSNQEEGVRFLRTISKDRCYCNKPNCREWLFGSR